MMGILLGILAFLFGGALIAMAVYVPDVLAQGWRTYVAQEFVRAPLIRVLRTHQNDTTPRGNMYPKNGGGSGKHAWWNVAEVEEVYLSTITNLAAVIREGKTPEVTDVGPYVFRRLTRHFDVTFHGKGGEDLEDASQAESVSKNYKPAGHFCPDP